MGFLTQLFERRMTLGELDALMDRAVSGTPTASGVDMSPETALTITAVYQAQRIISETVGSLPLHLYRRLEGGGKARASDYWLYPILHHRANPEQTSMEWREMMQGHLTIRGNAYSEIQRNQAGQIVALWPIPTDYVRVERVNSRLLYRVRPVNNIGPWIPIPASNMFHLRGLSSNGVTGLSPIALFREALGLNLALQEFGSRLFKNATHIGGTLEHPGKLSGPAYTRLKAAVEAQHSGLTQAHRMMILEEGMKWTKTSIDPDDAQFLDSRRFSVAEVARMFNMRPHMLMDLERSTFSNAEQEAISLVVFCFRPWLVRWEQRIMMDLIPEEDQGTIFPEFLVDGLLRGETKARYDAYAIAKEKGWMNSDEIRELENMNPIPNGAGKIYWQPVNMVEAGSSPLSDADLGG